MMNNTILPRTENIIIFPTNKRCLRRYQKWTLFGMENCQKYTH